MCPAHFHRWCSKQIPFAFARGTFAGAPHLYEIPITLISGPTRNHMPQVARHRGNTGTDKGRLSPQTGGTIFGVVARSIQMLDVILLAIGLGFFALSVGYTIACDRL